MALLGSLYYFTLGDDPRLVKDSVLAVMLLTGLFGAVFSAASSVAQEIRTGTALAVLAKPVGRIQFLMAKFAGVALALTVLAYINLLAALLASRMGFDVYGEPDYLALTIFYGSIVAGLTFGALSNFYLSRSFVKDSVLALIVLLTLAFITINLFNDQGQRQAFGEGVDWRLLRAGVLLLFALWVFAGVAIALTTRLELIPTLAVCGILFLLGLMSDYLFGRPAEDGALWAQVIYSILPNWQLFWAVDALEGDKIIPWIYVRDAFGYVVGYLIAALAVGVLLFEERELG